MITAATPEAAMLPVKINGIDGPAGSVAKSKFITHFLQFISYCFRCVVLLTKISPGFGLRSSIFVPPSESQSWLVLILAASACFLYCHSKFNHIQKKLQQILILRIATLHSK